jgi:hypothetical protein
MPLPKRWRCDRVGWAARFGLPMLDAHQITRVHDEATARWHGPEPWPDAAWLERLSQSAAAELVGTALGNHRANFDLWHEEDKAREPGASDATIVQVKHNIDRLNQQRNDLVEAMDRILLAAAGEQNEQAPLHSETPGLILDRLSILALKIFHTEEESGRESASDTHRERNRARLSVLLEQRGDLASCLDALWDDILHGRRRFKLYRQMKMYNDPELNPAIYKHQIAHPAS